MVILPSEDPHKTMEIESAETQTVFGIVLWYKNLYINVEYTYLEFRVLLHKVPFHKRMYWIHCGIGSEGVGSVGYVEGSLFNGEFLFNIAIYGTVVVVFNPKIIKWLTRKRKSDYLEP